MEMAPVAGSYMAASAKDCCVATVWEHGGCKRKGVDSPSAVSGLLGRVRKQSRTVALRAAVVVLVAAAVAEAASDVVCDAGTTVLVWLNFAWTCAASKKRNAPVFNGVCMVLEGYINS